MSLWFMVWRLRLRGGFWALGGRARAVCCLIWRFRHVIRLKEETYSYDKLPKRHRGAKQGSTQRHLVVGKCYLVFK